MKLLLFFGLLISIACTTKTENSDRSASENEISEVSVIEAKLKQYYQDMSDRNWQKYRMHFWDSATIATAWQKPGNNTARVHIITIDEFIRQAPEGPDSQPVFEERLVDAQIKTRENLAEAWVRYNAKFGKPDSLMQWTGTDVFTYMRHGGEWKIVSLAFEADQ